MYTIHDRMIKQLMRRLSVPDLMSDPELRLAMMLLGKLAAHGWSCQSLLPPAQEAVMPKEEAPLPCLLASMQGNRHRRADKGRKPIISAAKPWRRARQV